MPSGLIVPSGSNHVRLEAAGSAFRVFINGSLAFHRTDTTLSEPGILGLFVTTTTASDTVYFDNLRVYTLPR